MARHNCFRFYLTFKFDFFFQVDTVYKPLVIYIPVKMEGYAAWPLQTDTSAHVLEVLEAPIASGNCNLVI
jgi:hypothetical protein